jgi:hypothetical protein
MMTHSQSLDDVGCGQSVWAVTLPVDTLEQPGLDEHFPWHRIRRMPRK